MSAAAGVAPGVLARAASGRARRVADEGPAGASGPSDGEDVHGGSQAAAPDTAQTLGVAEAARLLGRDRTRIYALLRSGDLVAAGQGDGSAAGPVRIERSSLERWLVAGGETGRPLSARNAWALIGLASGDQPFADRCLGLLERAEDVSRTRARLRRERLIDLAPRLRRRAMVVVRQVPRAVRQALEHDAALVRTGISAAGAYGWDALGAGVQAWLLDAYLPLGAFSVLQEQLNRLDLDVPPDGVEIEREAVLLRVVDDPWPFPPHSALAPQPLAALDLLDYPDEVAARLGREVLSSMAETTPLVLARRSAKARAMTGPLTGRLLELRSGRGPRPVVEGDPKTDTRAAAAHIVGVLWASASQAVTVKELRAAVGLSRERFEDAYVFLAEHPPLGLVVQRHGDELRLVTAPEVASSVERHLNVERPAVLSKAALEVLAIIAYRQPIARSGIELIRGLASDSAVGTLLERGLIAHNPHHLFVTTEAFLDFAALRDLADLPSPGADESSGGNDGA